MKKNTQNRIVLELKNKKETTLWDLSSLGLFNDVIEVINKMKRNGLIEIEKNGNLKLSAKGRKFYKKLLNFRIDKNFKKEYQALRKDLATANYDQLQLTIKSMLLKLDFMIKNGDVFDESIICLGDDDLLGICLALTGLPKNVLVVDIDERIVKYEIETSRRFKVRVKGLVHDLRDPIPKKFRKKFDVFVTEPPDTLNGLTLFFSRGCELLKDGGVAYVGLGKCNLSLKTYQKFQNRILRMGFAVTDILSNSLLYKVSKNELENWPEVNLPRWIKPPKKPWFRVDLLRAESFGNIKPLIKGRYSKDIMTYLQK
jgi:hypothetical protein